MKNSVFVLILVLCMSFIMGCNDEDTDTPPPPTNTEPAAPVPEGWVYGVTMDNIAKLDDIVVSLKSFNKKPTTRIVFDEYVKATYYLEAAKRISKVSFIMGELLDSFYVKRYSMSKYKARTHEYYNLLGSYINVWEIGNEINGDWLDDKAIQKAEVAHNIMKSHGAETALTLYYNKGCEDSNGPMMAWVKNNVPSGMKKELDWVTVSYYEDDCNGRVVPISEWSSVFKELHTVFPNAKFFIGECGTKKSKKKKEFMTRCYNMRLPDVPQFKGGFFWWYGYQDLVPKTKSLWSVLNNLWGE